MTALEDLTTLVSSLPNASLLTDGMKTTALAGSLIPDSSLVWPGNPGYVPTYDIYFAAITLLGFLAAQPVVRQSSSEGTSVAVDAPQWGMLRTYFHSQSVIWQATSGNVLRPINIPDRPHVVPVNMHDTAGWRDGSDNVDTDLD